MTEAAPIVSSVLGSFSWGVFHKRHPALIKQIRDAFPWPPDRQAALDELAQRAITGFIEPLSDSAHDKALWDTWSEGNYGKAWTQAPFLWAESYFYRQLLDAVGYFAPGPWQGIDPFRPFKATELRAPAVDAELAALDKSTSSSPKDLANALLNASLWGNRADLGFRITAGPGVSEADEADLVADDSPLLWQLLAENAPATLSFVADNAGRELLSDLILIDHLMHSGAEHQVILHLKPYPYYVSDATTADVLEVLDRITAAGGSAGQVGHRLWSAMTDGRLKVRTHPFWCAPLSFHHMPPDLANEIAATAVTILKGDLNYRRVVGDLTWPATSSFPKLTRYFPSPLATLRTLKSQVVVGLGPELLAGLDVAGQHWRTDGNHALIQVRR